MNLYAERKLKEKFEFKRKHASFQLGFPSAGV